MSGKGDGALEVVEVVGVSVHSLAKRSARDSSGWCSSWSWGLTTCSPFPSLGMVSVVAVGDDGCGCCDSIIHLCW